MAVDRISMLPDEILHHILSFLPTQTAAATSILSKRWKPLWLSVPTLFFDDRSYILNNKPYHYFAKSIYATILDRDVPIKKFRLQFKGSDYDCFDFDLKIWVKAAIQRGLENLYIHLAQRINGQSLRTCIFSCKTLVVLKLVGLRVDEFSSVDLPSLKTMFFMDVTFPELQYFMDLLAGSPVLENMHLCGVYYDANEGDYDIPSNKKFGTLSKLVRVYIHDIGFDNFVETLGIGKDLDDILVFPNLTDVALSCACFMSWHSVLAMLKHCPMLQYFSLDMYGGDSGWISPSFVPECLSSQLRKCYIFNYEGTENQLHFTKYIMQNSSVLRVMMICTELVVDNLELLKELSSCPRSSMICELSISHSNEDE